MHSELYWIASDTHPKLAIMARPRAGDWLEDEIAYWRRSGVEIAISLLERDEIEELGLGVEAELCKESGIRYLSYPIPDRGIPDTGDAMRFAADIAGMGRPTAIHCRAGIGRSSIMAAAILVSGGVDPAAALLAIQDARRVPVPDTDEQREWVMQLAR
jgi:protein-tyrosine phosphatase